MIYIGSFELTGFSEFGELSFRCRRSLLSGFLELGLELFGGSLKK